MTDPAGTQQVVDSIIEKLEAKKAKTGKARLRHYVELDQEGNATDQCLCGYLWDQLHVPHNGSICQECVDVLRRREAPR